MGILCKVSGALLLVVAVLGGYLVHRYVLPNRDAVLRGLLGQADENKRRRRGAWSDPYLDILWSNCEAIARRAMFDAGMLFAGCCSPRTTGHGQGLA